MTWLQTASGRAFDLLHPDWRLVDFEVDVPEALARVARFTGHVRSGPYSVAQHSVLGADAVFRKNGPKAAAAFLLHDAHEAYLGDIATPIAAAIAIVVPEPGEAVVLGPYERPDRDGNIHRAEIAAQIKRLKKRIDRAIYHAAGMGEDGCPVQFRQMVADYDLAMLAAETRQLLGPSPRPWPSLEGVEPVRLVGGITVWPWHRAADEFRDRLRRYLPERFGAPAPRPQPKAGPRARKPVEA